MTATTMACCPFCRKVFQFEWGEAITTVIDGKRRFVCQPCNDRLMVIAKTAAPQKSNGSVPAG
jgi:hypothetical protein